jgi:hypothetical protein
MKRINLKLMLTTMIVMIAILGSSITVFASASAGSNGTIVNAMTDVSSLSTSVKSMFATSSDPLDPNYDDTYNYYSGSDGKYYFIKKSEEDSAAQAIAKSAANTAAANDLSLISDNLGIDATSGIQAAEVSLAPFAGILNTVLGVIVVAVSLGMTLFTGIDICYIVFPVFRGKMDDAKSSGNSMVGKQDKKTGETKFRFITDEAVYAVNSANVEESGKNPLVIYAGKRALSFIVVAIVLFIFMTGNITLFTSLALKLVSGILDVLGAV